MEDQTQVVGDEDREVDGDSDIRPVGYLRVLNQKDLEQTDYPFHEGRGREHTLTRERERERERPPTD